MSVSQRETSSDTFEFHFAYESLPPFFGDSFFGLGLSFFGDDENSRSYSDRRPYFCLLGEPALLVDVPVFQLRSRLFAVCVLCWPPLIVCVESTAFGVASYLVTAGGRGCTWNAASSILFRRTAAPGRGLARTLTFFGLLGLTFPSSPGSECTSLFINLLRISSS